MAKRIIAGIILLLSIFLAPFWLQALLALALLFYFRNYYEFMIAFLVSDLAYGISEERFWNIKLFSFFVSIIIFMLVSILKSKLSFYKDQR